MLACSLVTRTCLKATRGLISGMFRRLTLELLSPEKQLLSYLKTIQIFNDFTCWLVWNERMLAHWTQVSDRCPLGYLFFMCKLVKKLIEKSRECHSLNPQPTPDTKRKRKRTEISACKINNQMHEKHIDQLCHPQSLHNGKQDWKYTRTKCKVRLNFHKLLWASRRWKPSRTSWPPSHFKPATDDFNLYIPYLLLSMAHGQTQHIARILCSEVGNYWRWWWWNVS